jgi:hypothetical protein
MIQLNTTSLFGPQDQSNSLLPPSASQTDDGFQTALSAALSTTLQNFGINPNNVTLSITPTVSSTPAAQAAPTAQVASTLPAVTPFSAASNTGNATESTTPVSDATTSTTPTTPSTTTTAGSSSDDSTEAFDNAYWAAQPPAVQALRNMDSYEERTQLASQLSAQGYTIDVPIMVYGWDPAKITAARESYGYTWVPSASQNPIAEAPGISTPGTVAYNASNPPAGSIAV